MVRIDHLGEAEGQARANITLTCDLFLATYILVAITMDLVVNTFFFGIFVRLQ